MYYILDPDFELYDVVRNYQSMIWTDKYYEAGDFELYIPADEYAMKNFVQMSKTNHYYIIKDFSNTDTDYLKDVMIINNIESVTDAEQGRHLVITGKSLKHLLAQRIVWGQTNLSGKLEEQLRKAVYDNAINPGNQGRVIPRLILGAESGVDDIINVQTSGKALDKLLEEVCKTFNCGWDIKLNIRTKQLEFVIWKGVDRSYSQTGPIENRNSYVVFSTKFDNLLSTKYMVKTDNYKNMAYVEARYSEYNEKKDENEFKDYSQEVRSEKIDKAASGYDRYEMYVDGSSINAQYAANLNLYGYLLQQKGKTELKKYDNTAEISGKVVPNLTYKVYKDYFLGDLVTIQNEYDQKFDARVTGITFTETVTKRQTIPAFTIEHWDESQDEEKIISEQWYRCEEQNTDEYRVTANGSLRVVDRGYKKGERCTEDGQSRTTENGITRQVLLHDNYKDN